VFIGVAPGTYSVTVQIASGCISGATQVTVNPQPTTVVPTVSIAASSTSICTGGSVTFTATPVNGGTAPTYQWQVNGVTVAGQTAVTFTSATLNNNDVVTVIMTSNDPCAAPASATSNAINISATSPTAVVITTTNATCGNNNGTLTIGNVTGGTAPYSYSVDGLPFSTTLVYNSLAAGLHTVDVKDAKGCVYSTTATVTGITGPSAVVITTTNPACGVSNGTLTIGAVTGGTAPYTYSIDASPFTATLVYNNLAAGSHTVDVKDANGCVFATTAGISNIGGPTAAALTTTDATCGNNNGTITIGAVTGGTAPYTYSVDGSAFTATLVYNNLSGGPHTIDVKDVNGCVFATTTTIASHAGPTAVAITATNATCGNANGTLSIGGVTGGTAPYTYSVDGSPFTTTLVYNNLAVGSHTVNVSDVNGCIFATTTAIANAAAPTAVAITATGAACGNNNGTLTIGAVTGGTTPYTYSVDGSAFTATLVYNNMVAGSHTVDVKDANGCVFSTTAAINSVGGPTAVVITPTNSTCGNANGTLTIGTVAGGTAPYTYSVDGLPFNTTLIYNNLAGGSHTIDVKDASGCVFATTTTIANSAGPTAVAITTTGAACAATNGTLTIGAITGGTAPYSYSVDGSVFGATLVYNNLAAGTHAVDVKDANGCIFATTATINSTNGPTAAIITTVSSTCAANNGRITIGAVTGGTAPYTYSIDGSAFTSTVVYNNLTPGSHTVQVKDVSGCIFATIVTVNNTSPVLSSTTNASVCPNELPYSWNNTTYPVPGTYTVKLTSVAGCDSLATLVLTLKPTLPGVRYSTVVTQPNVPVQLIARNLGADYTYDWNPKFGLNDYSINSPVFTYHQTVDYTITMTPTSGCAVTDTVLVNVLEDVPTIVSDIFVPRAWSPNNDGHNDKLFPIPVNIKELKFFRIFNRWGQLVFETNILRNGWDGIFQGQPQVMDTYTWTLEAVGEDGTYFRKAGNSVLIR